MEITMLARLRFILVLSVVLGLCVCFFIPNGYGKSRKSRQYFKWVQPHVDSSGRYIPGHWNYIGPPKPGIEWVPGHFDRKGEWVVGRWKPVGQKEDKQVVEIEEDFGE